MNKDAVLSYLIKKEQCCTLDNDEYELKDALESGEFKDALDIIDNWLNPILDYEDEEKLLAEINELEDKDFGNIIDLVNEHLGDDNKDGEFDGVAMELEEYFEQWEDFENYEE